MFVSFFVGLFVGLLVGLHVDLFLGLFVLGNNLVVHLLLCLLVLNWF